MPSWKSRTLSLDADAVACTDLSIMRAFREADSVEEAGGPLALVNAEWVNHERLERPAQIVTTLASRQRATRPVLFGISKLAAGDVCDDKWHAGAGVSPCAAKSCDANRAFKLNAGFCLFRKTDGTRRRPSPTSSCTILPKSWPTIGYRTTSRCI